MSNLEDYVDVNKMRALLFDEITLSNMNDADFKDYKFRILNTNMTFFEKANELSKFGKKGNKMEQGYLDTISKNYDSMNESFTCLKQKLKRIQLFFKVVNLDSIWNISLDEEKWVDP